MFRRILILAVSTAVVLMSLGRVAIAQSDGGSGLSISPTRAEFTISKGGASNIQVTLKNTSGVDVIAKAVINDFESDNQSGEPKIIVNTTKDSANSVKKFLIGVADIPLKKDEIKKFDIPVQVPKNAVSGAYFGVIRYTAQTDVKTDVDARQVALNASLGLIVLIQVPGNITEQVQAQKISVSRNGSDGTVFLSAPNKSNVTLKNTGNGFTKPFGRVTVKKGDKEVYNYEMNNTDPRSNILPGARRTFSDEIKNVGSFGRYTVVASVSYGSGGDTLTLKSSFWVIPPIVLIAFLLSILLIIIVAYIVYRILSRRRSRKHRY